MQELNVRDISCLWLLRLTASIHAIDMVKIIDIGRCNVSGFMVKRKNNMLFFFKITLIYLTIFFDEIKN